MSNAAREGRSLWTPRVVLGGGFVAAVLLASLLTLPFTLSERSALFYDRQTSDLVRHAPAAVPTGWFGYDTVGRSILARCLLGGSISLMVGS